jgi:integrase
MAIAIHRSRHGPYAVPRLFYDDEMAHVEDRWEKVIEGGRIRTDRYGKGKRWRARYADADGRDRSQSFSRKGDAEKFLATVTADVLRGSYVDPQRSKLPFQDYAQRWLAAQTLAPSSRRTYEIYLRTRINPELGHRALGSLTPTDVRLLLRGLHDDLSRLTVHHVHGLLSTILRAAVEDGYLTKNPAHAPHGTAPGKGRHPAIKPRSVEQVQALIDAMPDRYRLAALLGAGCGLRVGEVLGLRIGSVRIDDGELAVVEQLQLLPGSPPVLRPPKTASSIRVVPLPQIVADAIVLHLELWPGDDEDLVLRSRTGAHIWPNTFNDSIWRAAAKRAGQPDVRFHELRHFYASALIRAGESVKTVQAALGYVSAVETLETYAGLWPDNDARTRAARRRPRPVQSLP